MFQKPAIYLLLAVMSFVVACKQSNNEINVPETKKEKKHKKKHAPAENLGALAEQEPTLFGYRFSITGDFDGDGKKETLTECFISKINGQELDQFLAADDEEGRNIYRIERWQAFSFLTSSNRKIDTLFFELDNPAYGLAYLKNEGDLDGDGADEISYVIRWADVSNLNTCHVVSFKNQQWIHLYSFPIWDWQLPELPIYATQAEWKRNATQSNTKLNQRFAGLIKKIRPREFEIVYRNDDAEEDTKTVEL